MIAVTGASGWIGAAVCTWMGIQGREVRGLVRRPTRPTDRSFDLTAPDVDARWRTALEGCDTLIHCAAHVHRPVEDERNRALFAATNAAGTRRLAQACQAAGVRRIVYASSIAVYDWPRGNFAREENDGVAGSTAYAASKLAGEAEVRRFAGDWRIARLATVYGVGDRAHFSKLATAIGTKRFVVPGHGEARKSVLPVDLAAELLVDLAIRENVPHPVVNLALPEAPRLREIADAFSETCGFRRAQGLPLWFLRSMSKVGDAVDRVRPGFPLTSVNLKKLTTSTVVGTDRMQDIWPERQWPTFEEALKPSANYYRSLSARR